MFKIFRFARECGINGSHTSLRSVIVSRNLSDTIHGTDHEDDMKHRFFEPEIQRLLKQLTRMNLDKIFRKRNLEKKAAAPTYKFMTSKQVEEEVKRATKRAEARLQMPPMLPPREEVNETVCVDSKLVGLDPSNSNYVFTDISFGKTNRNRVIVVREPDGTLRKAKWDERHRMNQIYFPVAGRKLFAPQVFKAENLSGLCEKAEYIFLLDLACLQYEPDDPEYLRVTTTVYNHVDEMEKYEILRSTRHYGPLMFHIVAQRNIDNLIAENLKTDRLEDAVWAINLLHLLKPESKSANTVYEPGEELKFIKSYIEQDSKKRGVLEMTVKSYLVSKESLPGVQQQVN